MTYDAGDRKSVRRAEKQARVLAAEQRQFIASIVRTIAGRKWFYDLLASCHVFESAFNDSPIRNAFLEGERNVGLRLLADLTASEPEALILMLREHNERSTRPDDIRDADPAASAEHPGSADPGRDVEGRIDSDYDLYSNPGTETRGEA